MKRKLLVISFLVTLLSCSYNKETKTEPPHDPIGLDQQKPYGTSAKPGGELVVSSEGSFLMGYHFYVGKIHYILPFKGDVINYTQDSLDYEDYLRYLKEE